MDITYDSGEHAFTLSEGEYFSVEVVFPFIDHRGDEQFKFPYIGDYELKDYYKINIGENDINVLYVSNKSLSSNDNGRVGWSIPYISLISKEHDFALDEHFAEYAFALYVHILSNVGFQNIMKDNDGDFNVSFNQYYVDSEEDNKISRVAFIAEKNNFTLNLSFDAFDFCMMQYGYSPVKRIAENSKQKSTGSNKKIDLQRTSLDVYSADNKYENEYYGKFLQIISIENEPILSFLYLYQVFEILIESVLVNKLTKLLEKVKHGAASARDFDTYLHNNAEINRLSKICESSGIMQSQYAEDLNNECNEYLMRQGQEKVAVPYGMYHVRNQIVHRFRLFLNEAKAIKEINESLEMFILELLINYKMPNN